MAYLDSSPDFSRPSGVDLNALASRGAGAVEFGQGDRGKLVTFEWRQVPNGEKSRAAGRPIYDRRAFVRMQDIGDNTTIIEREVRSDGSPMDDRYRFPRQWNAFIRNQQHVPEGTPTSVLFPNNPETVANLKSWGIHVVEQLAAVNAHGIDQIGMGAQEWVNRAKRYIETAQKGVDYHEIEKMKEMHAREMAAMQRQIADLTNHLSRVTSVLNDQSAAVQARVAHEAPAGAVLPRELQQFPYSAPPPQPPRQLSQEELLQPVDIPGAVQTEWRAPDAGILDQVPAEGYDGDPQADMIAANHPAGEVAEQRRRGRRA
jgi:hypothetical protein